MTDHIIIVKKILIPSWDPSVVPHLMLNKGDVVYIDGTDLCISGKCGYTHRPNYYYLGKLPNGRVQASNVVEWIKYRNQLTWWDRFKQKFQSKP